MQTVQSLNSCLKCKAKCPNCGANLERLLETTKLDVIEGKASENFNNIVRCTKCDFKQIMGTGHMNRKLKTLE